MVNYERSSKRNAKLLVGDAFAIMAARTLAHQIPTLVDGILLFVTEATGVLLLVDCAWLYLAKKRQNADKQQV